MIGLIQLMLLASLHLLAAWALPFWSTVEASVNTAKYGHEIEHAAENILAMCVFACAAGGIISAGTSLLVLRRNHR